MNEPGLVKASDLVGCRWRPYLRATLPEIGPSEAEEQRRARWETAWSEVLSMLPSARGGAFTRTDITTEGWDREMDTLEAIARETSIITRPRFTTNVAENVAEVEFDILLRNGDGTYTPVVVSNQRIIKKAKRGSVRALPVGRLGKDPGADVPGKHRHHPQESYTLALAARALHELERDSGVGGIIGQDRAHVYLLRTAEYQKALDAALEVPVPAGPRAMRDCPTCRFWPRCYAQLKANDDISLFLSGDQAEGYRRRGIDTVQKLIDADITPTSQLAAAWRAGITLLRNPRAGRLPVARFEREIDVDVEAYMDAGAYLWGTWDGGKYRPFVTWGELGSVAEGANFAAFWTWLKGQIADPNVGVFCYANGGENHWLRSSAARFGGRQYGDTTAPTLEEIERFIASPQWIDVFAAVRAHLVGTKGLGLKTVAPQAGFTWRSVGFDGEESINAYRVAVGMAGGVEPKMPGGQQAALVERRAQAALGEQRAQAARAELLRYNEDDCRATAAVRQWLREGAPGIPTLRL